MLLTIAIPHKNSSVLLERLLKSIPSHNNWQTIVVDDHSSEQERKAVSLLQEKYNFELFDTTGNTAGGARNTALAHAKGKWIIFSDADDFFTPEFATTIQQYFDCDADIVYFNMTSVVSDTGEPASRHEHVRQMIAKYKATGDEGYLRCKLLGPTAKLIRRDLIELNNIRFEERSAGNDMWFCANTGLKASKILCVDKIIYCITLSNGSITTTLSKDRFEDRLQATIRTNRLIRSYGQHKYQTSLLYFLGKSYQFGLKYTFHVIWDVFTSGTSPLIGISKLFRIKQVIADRQNKQFLKVDESHS